MLSLLNCELMKLQKSTTFKILIAVMAVMGFALSLVMIFQQEKLVGVMGGIENLRALPTFWQTFSENDVLLLMGTIMSAIFICADFENRTIQECVISGHSHFAILFSKTMVYLAAMIVIFLPYPIVRSICAGFAFGGGFEQITGNYLFISGLKLIGLVFAYSSMMTICVVISFMARKVGITMGINVAALFLGSQILSFIMGLSDITAMIYSYTPLGLYTRLLTESVTAAECISIMFISACWIAILVYLTAIFFKRKELK